MTINRAPQNIENFQCCGNPPSIVLLLNDRPVQNAESWPSLMRYAWCCILATAGLTACTTYRPAPIDPAGIVATQRSLVVDKDAVRRKVAALAPATEWNGREWNGLALLAAALLYNSQIEQARATAQAVAAEALAARVAPGPNFNLSDEYAFGPAGAPAWIVGIAGDMLLDVGGRRKSRITRAEIEARISLYDFAAQVWSVRMAIRRAIVGYVSAEREAGPARGLVAARERQLATLSRRLSAGAARLDDVARVRQLLADTQKILAEIETRRTATMLDLAAAVGVPATALAAATLPRVGDEATLPSPDLLNDTVREQALLARPDVLRATAAYDEAETALKLAVAAQYPEVRLGPSFQSDQGVSKLGISLGLAFPTLDLNKAAIRAAESRRREAARRVEDVLAAAGAMISRANADYKAARSALALVQERILPAARTQARRADAALAAGTIGRAEWAAAQAGLRSAELDEAAAMRQALQAAAGLEDALRRPLTGPEVRINTDLSALGDWP